MYRLFIILTILAISCKSQKSNQNQSDIHDDLILLFEDAYYTVDSSKTMVINSQKELNNLFSEINRTRKPGLAVPIVDFSRKTLIVVCAGEQKGIERIELVKTAEDHSSVEISIKKVKGEKEAQISYPFCVYELPKTNKKFTFN